MIHLDARLRDRLFSRLVIDPSGCLIWTGTRDRQGYGRIWISGRHYPVHQITYEMFAASIPEEHELDHLCRMPPCAAPAHLEAVTHRENMLRGRGIGSANAAKEYCASGHEYDLLNTYYMPNGHRDCRTCIRARARKYKAKRAAS